MRERGKTARNKHLKKRFNTALFAACLLICLYPQNLKAQDIKSLTDEDLKQAFELGLGSSLKSDKPPRLMVKRFGSTFLFNANNKKELICSLCTSAEALSKARSFGAMLGSELRGEGLASLYWSNAGDEMITVDGVPVSPLQGNHPMEPGKHLVSKRTANGEISGSIVIEPGKTADVTSFKTLKNYNKLRLSIAMMGLGLTTIAIGGVYFWLDGNCNVRDCSTHHKTKGLGWVLVSVGAVVDIGALVWLLWPSRSDANRKEAPK